jgi:hypothetical protein
VAHELAHLARRDPHWLALGCLVERIFFFQPLNRIARQRLQEAAEYLCDDWAVRRTGSGDSLAACLVKVAEWVGTAPRPIPLAGIAERPSQLVIRVHRLIKGGTMPARSRTIWLAPAPSRWSLHRHRRAGHHGITAAGHNRRRASEREVGHR